MYLCNYCERPFAADHKPIYDAGADELKCQLCMIWTARNYGLDPVYEAFPHDAPYPWAAQLAMAQAAGQAP